MGGGGNQTVNAADTDALTGKALDLLTSKWQDGAATRTQKASDQKTSVNLREISDNARVVNVESNGRCGFVLFADSGDDAVTIGYGLADTLDIRNLPPAAADFISRYTKAVSAKATIANTTQSGNTYPAPTVEPVEPFIKTKWGQGEPFNGKCPKYQGKPSVTGCVATALGQILHYYRADNFNDYTLEYSDPESLAEVSVNFSSLHFDYGKMLDAYTDGSYTQEQADAVAEMMYAAGASAKMEWTDTKSSGKWPLVSLDKYFNINATFLIRQALPTGYWMKKIQENLAAGKPILYTGAGVSSSKWSAHIFILDGIDENNYVHVNWGWSGLADGYYDITFCHPSVFDPGEDGYYTDQYMICDISPRAAGEKYAERFVCTSGSQMTDLNSYHHTLEGKFTGYTTNSYESIADYTAKIVAVNGTSVTSLGAADHYYLKQFPEWGYISWSAISQAYPNYLQDRLGDGEYEMMIATCVYETDEIVSYEPLPMRPYFTISGGYFTEWGYKDFPEGKGSWYDETEYLSFDEFTPLTDVIAKAPFMARIKTHSLITAIDSHDVDSKQLCFTNLETGKDYLTTARVSIYDLEYSGLHYEGYAMIEPPTNEDNGFTMPEGRYKLSTTDNRVVFPDPIYVDVAPVVDYPVLKYDLNGTLMLSSWNDSYYTKRWGEKLQILRNANYKVLTTSNNCYNPVTVNVYARHPEEDKSKEILVSSFDFDPTTGLDGLDFDLPGNLYPLEGEYMFYMRYATPDGEKIVLPNGNIYKLNELREKYEFLAEPTRHNIVANSSAGLPMLETSGTSLQGNTVAFNVKNIGAADFSGTVVVRMCNSGTGNIAEYTVEHVSLTPDEQKALSVEVATAENCVYETYILSTAATSPQSAAISAAAAATVDYTLATKEDGSVAHYRLGAGAGIDDNPANKSDISATAVDGTIIISGATDPDTASVYSVDGKLILSTAEKAISGLPRGIYIVRVSGSSFKVVL